MHRWILCGWLFAAMLTASGCEDTTTPPGEPRNVYTVTGDSEVILYWSPPPDHDLEGFNVFISRNDVDYHFVDAVDWSRRHYLIDDNALSNDIPFSFVNGNTYYIGLTAFDRDGNESKLSSRSTTFDTPRPMGSDLRLYDINGSHSSESGYDFSRSPYGYAMDGSSLFADIYFVYESVNPVMRTRYPEVVEMQDKGLLSFDDAACGYLFEDEWRPFSSVLLSLGHVYIVKIYEESLGNLPSPFNVAKFQVVGLDGESVTIDWAYQIAPNNRELKPFGTVSGHLSTARKEALR